MGEHDGTVFLTPHLRLVPFSERYLTAAYMAWLNDPQLMASSEQRHRRHSEVSSKAYLYGFGRTPNHYWAITLWEDGLHIGNFSVEVNEANSLANMSILIGHAGCAGRAKALRHGKARATTSSARSACARCRAE